MRLVENPAEVAPPADAGPAAEPDGDYFAWTDDPQAEPDPDDLETPAAGELNFTIEKVGLGYWARAGMVQLGLGHFRETRGEVTAELTVNLGDRHLSRARFNLSSLSARTTQARYLAGVRLVSQVPWREVLERLCLEVLNLHREGPATVRLDQVEDLAAKWLLRPVLQRDVPTVVYAPGGAGKSTLAAAIAVSVVTGYEVVPGWQPTSAPVLVLDYEHMQRAWAARCQAIARGVGAPAPDILYRQPRRPLAECAEEVAAFVAERGIGLVIVDSKGFAAGSTREGGTAEESTLRLFEALNLLDCTALVVDHVTGAELASDHVATRPYGSVYTWNAARSLFELRRERESEGGRAELLLRHAKVNDGALLAPQGLIVTHGRDTIRFERADVEAPELVGTLPLVERMARALREGALATADLAQQLDASPATVRSCLKRYEGRRFHRLNDGRVALMAHV